jgi:ribonucleoside-diphosphate reductase beta chain
MVGVYAAGLEGIELMAQFAMLLAWQELGQFNGMSQINTYSVLDENIHQLVNTKMFLELAKENEDVYTEEVRADIRNALAQVAEQEIAMTNYLYDNGEHPTITREQAVNFVKFMTDRALSLLELDVLFNIETNPIPFMDEILANTEFANFFEVDVTAYSKDVIAGDWNDVDTHKHDFMEIKRQSMVE